ncbi:restriction endonuclease subunit S [Photobacterium leiognathi]|uniref:restriction endonuclease subunit S n=1 Tax=Photobacterium leiognathi TaxID=553611 RepID=UPI002981C8FC|nr:restriction endonuclease subunit S [Photobacterium leiognathi]
MVPTGWDILPCRAAVKNISEKNDDSRIQNYLSLMANVGVIRYEDKGDIGNKKPDDLSKCKIVKKGNLVINSMNYAIGSYGMSDFDGVCSPVYIVLDANTDVIEQRFALRVFENSPFQKYLATFGNGILAHRAAINWDDIKGAYIPIPPKCEQRKILHFLDHETAKIDTLIEKQQQLIELLKEKRQAVISHAVTKGLNPDAPMKDSGVEWLGEVPKHWDVLSIQRVLQKIEQGSSPVAQNRAPQEGEFGVLKISAVKKGCFNAQESKTLDSFSQYEPKFRIIQGDLLVTRANTPSLVANACVVNKEPKNPIMMCDLIYRLVTTNKINNHFLCAWLLSNFGRIQVEADARGSSMTMAKVSQGHIKSWLTVLPPLNEQNEIVVYLKQSDKKLSQLICQAENAIELLKERRTALISAAVTGKIDVRNWVAPTTSSDTNEAAQEVTA